MTVKWEKLEGNTGVLTVEVSAEKVSEGLTAAFNKVVKTVNVPGFRKGKMPRQMFEKRFGVEALYQDALDILLPEAYSNAIDETGIEPIDRPDIDIEQMEKGKELIFKAKVQVKPEVTLGEYKGLEVEELDTTVTDEDVAKELETLQKQDDIIQNEIAKINVKDSTSSLSSSDISFYLGKAASNNSLFPEKSFMVSAYNNNVPVYIPAIADSSIGMNMLPLLFESKLPNYNLVSDIAESAAILWKSKLSAGIELGGGVPKNFFQQTGPTLYQILKIQEGGHDYVIQLTDARPDTGGLSGATIQEGKSWGKIKSSHTGNVIVYGDSSVYFPILCSYILSECQQRKPKQLYNLKNQYLREMKSEYLKKKSV